MLKENKINVNLLITELLKCVEKRANAIETLQKSNTVLVSKEYVTNLVQALNKLLSTLNKCKGGDIND